MFATLVRIAIQIFVNLKVCRRDVLSFEVILLLR